MNDMPKQFAAPTDRRAEVALADLVNRAVPRILPMLGDARLHDTIIERLRLWIRALREGDQAALSLDALDHAAGDLSCLY